MSEVARLRSIVGACWATFIRLPVPALSSPGRTPQNFPGLSNWPRAFEGEHIRKCLAPG